jgi:hypothetical protein
MIGILKLIGASQQGVPANASANNFRSRLVFINLRSPSYAIYGRGGCSDPYVKMEECTLRSSWVYNVHHG